MSSFSRVVRNSSALMASNVLGKGLSFLSVLIAARYLGVKGYGLLVFALSFCSIFKVVIDLGFSPLIVKDVARDRTITTTYVRKILYIKIFLVVVASVLLSISMRFLGYSGNESVVIWMLFVFVVLQSFANVGYCVLRAFEEIHLVAIGEVIMSISILAGFAISAYAGVDVATFSMSYAVTGCIILVYSIVVVRGMLKTMKAALPPSTASFSSLMLIKSSLPFVLMAAFNMLLLYLDSVMLGIFRTQGEVGIYGVAYRSALVLLFIPLAVHGSLVPVISRLYGEGSDDLTDNVRRSFRYNLIVGVPLGVGGTLLAWRLIPPVFGPEYREASLIFAILIWSLVFSFVRFPYLTMFEATDRQALVARTFAYAVGLNIFLNLVLIPRYGMVGAAAATVITDMLIMVQMLWLGIKAGVCRLDSYFWACIWKVILSASVMGGACLLALNFGVIISVATGFVVYLSIIWMVGALDMEDKAFIRNALGI